MEKLFCDEITTAECKEQFGIESSQDLKGDMVFCEDCPDQKENSLDCGYHVCHIMNRICSGEDIEKTLTDDALNQFKAHMMETFMKDFNLPN